MNPSQIDSAECRKGVTTTRNEELAPRHSPALSKGGLTRSSPDEFVAGMFVSLDEMRSWHRKGWLSFDPPTMVAYNESEFVEVQFIKGVARSGLSDAMINRMLCGLEKPYCYDPSTTFFSFEEDRWISLPAQPKPADVTNEYIDRLVADRQLDRLRKLQNRISQALEESEAVSGDDKSRKEEYLPIAAMSSTTGRD